MFVYRSLHCSFLFCLVAESCPALCNPMDCSTPGFSGSFLLLSQNDLKEMLSKLFTSEFSSIPGYVSRNLAVNPLSLKEHGTCLGSCHLTFKVFDCAGSPLLCRLFSDGSRWGATLSGCGARVSHCLSSGEAQALGARASAVAAPGLGGCGPRALEHRFSSGGTGA